MNVLMDIPLHPLILNAVLNVIQTVKRAKVKLIFAQVAILRDFCTLTIAFPNVQLI